MDLLVIEFTGKDAPSGSIVTVGKIVHSSEKNDKDTLKETIKRSIDSLKRAIDSSITDINVTINEFRTGRKWFEMNYKASAGGYLKIMEIKETNNKTSFEIVYSDYTSVNDLHIYVTEYIIGTFKAGE